jgi:hypothetical protein
MKTVRRNLVSGHSREVEVTKFKFLCSFKYINIEDDIVEVL